MPRSISKLFEYIDWPLFVSIIFISLAGLLTMKTFSGETNFFDRQIVWIVFSVVVFVTASNIDWRFLRRTSTVTFIYFAIITTLLLLFVVGSVFKGARSWFDIGLFAFQPVDFAKLSLVILLAKYFSRRHIEIANVRHILVSGFYAFVLFILVFLQPDFGSSVIIFAIWFGMVLASGISKKHLSIVFLSIIASGLFLWGVVFEDYQKARIVSFLNPLTDLQGAGYNAYQSTIAVGAGMLWGKGVGLGSQSKLEFLPEYETDFIFAAFAEEWGFVGAVLLFSLYGVVFFRVLGLSKRGGSNFETLFGLGILIIIFSHFIIHIGMNLALLPVTGITLPFMSYGGSHLLAEFFALGILCGMQNYGRLAKKDLIENEVIQVVE